MNICPHYQKTAHSQGILVTRKISGMLPIHWMISVARKHVAGTAKSFFVVPDVMEQRQKSILLRLKVSWMMHIVPSVVIAFGKPKKWTVRHALVVE